ncbi:protein O-linked-mannose beta-1,4-N-acetylglucosaminyltransferase 2-like [Dorcoceras hygrometricum]|uniref:Protein O-linked-mannose beta-1,4-N-acetylglucosaminyltransferase 2-like n=1 Tax=Dorcoceras hygrometricum TaxID=472368 RepID=A0A2Z7BAM9_9LAMI|nr:protein O-linked-mannose beta-1,4-N-acetylglucosaminyltransferase 2-like [Dorcoceras hygrometricum]
MQQAIINAMKCMRAIKDRIARPVYQLENHLSQPLYPHDVSTMEIIGTTHQSTSHNVAFNQPEIYACSSIKAVQSCSNSYLQQQISTSTDSQGTAQPIEASQPSPATAITVLRSSSIIQLPIPTEYFSTLKRGLNLARNHLPKSAQPFSCYGNHGRDSVELESVPEYFSTLKRGLNLARNHLPKSAQHPKNAMPDFSRNLRTPAASRSLPQVVLQSLMSMNRKSKPQGVQRHPNRRKQRLESTEI